MIMRKRNATAPNGWNDRSSVAFIDKPGGGKRAKEEQLAAVVQNTRRNQARLTKALETGNVERATVLASLVAKGMSDAKRLAADLEDAGRLTFAKAKTATAMRPIVVWAKGEQAQAIEKTGNSPMPSLPKATTTIGVTGDHKATVERMVAATAHKAARDAEAAAKAEAARISKAKAGKAKIRKAGKRS